MEHRDDVIYTCNYKTYKTVYSGVKGWRQLGVPISLDEPFEARHYKVNDKELLDIGKSLNPTPDMLGVKTGAMGKEEYIKKYTEILDKLDLVCIGEKLKGKVLLCYCDGFCHRHLLADALIAKGFTVIELKV